MKADRVFYKDEQKGVSGNVRFFAPLRSDEIVTEYERLELKYGSRVRIAGNLRREDAFLNPGVPSRKDLLDQQEMDVSGIIESPLLIEKIGEDRGFPPLAWVYEQRQNLIREFRNKFSVSTAGIMIASLLGDKYFLDRQTADIFREGGTFHVLVISGLHITFIGGLVVVALRLVTRRKLWQFIAANIFLWSYALAVGAQVPVVRAAIMFTILLLAQLIYQKRHAAQLARGLRDNFARLAAGRPLHGVVPAYIYERGRDRRLCLSADRELAPHRPLVAEYGRAVSSARCPGGSNVFARCSTGARRFGRSNENGTCGRQIFLSRPYFKWIEARGLKGLAAWLFEGVLVSLIVQIWLLPLLVVYFNRVSFASVLLNLWVGFFMGLESFSAVIAVIFAQVNSALALPVIKLTEILNWLLLSVPRIFVANDWASSRPALYSGVPTRDLRLIFHPRHFDRDSGQ